MEKGKVISRSILLGSDLLQVDCPTVCKGKGALRKTPCYLRRFLSIPGTTLSLAAKVLLGSSFPVNGSQQAKQSVATVSQMQEQTKNVNALARLPVMFHCIWPKRKNV